jgi:RimJ/RimL family protein N-acetyltransferase
MRHLVPFADRAARDAWVAAARKHWLDRGFGPWVVELPGEAPFIGVVGAQHRCHGTD